MTIIAAVKDSGRVFIGSDTLAQAGDTRQYIADGKWAVGPHWAIGLSGNLRSILVAREAVPNLHRDMTVMQVARSLRDAMRDDGYIAHDEKGDPLGHNISGLITNGVDLWDMDCSYTPLLVPKFSTRGVGMEFARGAMWALDGTAAGQALLCAGLECAIRNCRGCGGEMWVGVQVPTALKEAA